MLYRPNYAGEPALTAEFNQLAVVINSIVEENNPITFEPPSKPREGMIRYADGASWNPGSGEGLYQYDGDKWIQLGPGSGAVDAMAYFMGDN